MIQHERERGRERDAMIRGGRETARGGKGDSRTDRQTERCTNDIRYAILSL